MGLNRRARMRLAYFALPFLTLGGYSTRLLALVNLFLDLFFSKESQYASRLSS